MISWLLPFLFVFLAAAFAQLLATQIALIPLRRLSPDAHWSERARRGWSARVTSSSGPAMLLGILLVFPLDHDLPRGLAALAGFLGGIAGAIPALRFIFRRRVTFSEVIGEYGVGLCVLAPAHLIFLVMLLLLLPERGITPTSIAIMAGGFALALLLTVGLGLPVARILGLLRPASERLSSLVHQAAATVGMPPPRVLSMAGNQANAFAFPFAGLVTFTAAAERELTDDEILSVAAHELAHLSETVPMRLIRLSGLLVIFPAFTIPVWVREYDVAGAFIPLLCVFGGGRLLTTFARKMEHRADAMAHAHGEDQCELARALERIHAHNLVPAVMRGSKGQVHPHLYDRMTAAGLEPAFPRPKPPGILLTIFCLTLLIGATLSLAHLSAQGVPYLEASDEALEYPL